VVNRDKYEPVKLTITKEDLEKQIEAFLKPVQDTAAYGSVKPPDLGAARGLYTALIKPVEDRLSGTRLIIVPDGVLAKLPFEALIEVKDGTKHYLLERYGVKYVQSATVLALLRTEYKREGAGDTFIGFGDPVYDYDNFKAGKPEAGSDLKGVKAETGLAQLSRSGYLRAGGKLERLTGSGDEVRAIGSLFKAKGQEEKESLRLAAKEESAKAADMEQYGYIHYSTHGVLNDRFQAIALSQIPDDKEDGMLTLGEIMNSRYRAKLVVLSACQTGLGKMERGEGVTGLTRAVMYAGTPAVVVSLWSVSDQGTRALMEKFYTNMINQGLGKEEALRKAKLALIESGTYANPFFWSAFVMYGE
jgi:CHAT domain-containing protein